MSYFRPLTLVLKFCRFFERLPHVAARFCQPSPRVARAGASFEHHQRDRQIVPTLTQSVFGSGQAHAGRLFQNPRAAPP